MTYARGKGTKKDGNLGVFGMRNSRGAGKGDTISSTFNDSWLKAAEDRLKERRYPCSKCSHMKPEGVCSKCGYVPVGTRGW